MHYVSVVQAHARSYAIELIMLIFFRQCNVYTDTDS